ncbi:MAG: TonB family protein [Deltaproteobacteria bacterium]|nr:TonB family protein [Deltaproteobacteria bacterium]
MMVDKQNRVLGICLSVGLHGLAAVLLVLALSGNGLMPRDLARLDFVWVSLAAKDRPSVSPLKTHHAAKKSSAEPAAAMAQATPVHPGARVAEPEKSAGSFGAAPAEGPVSSAAKPVVYAAAGDPSSFSDAGRPQAASGAAPALSNAYPLYRENPPPGYPELARQQGYEGVVLVAAEILADGRVGQALVSKSSGYAILDQSAVRAVKKWKFEPAKKSGVPYKTWAELPIKFVINDRNSQS